MMVLYCPFLQHVVNNDKGEESLESMDELDGDVNGVTIFHKAYFNLLMSSSWIKLIGKSHVAIPLYRLVIFSFGSSHS